MILSHGKERVMVPTDFQAPFQHPDTLEFFKAVKKKFKPTKIVCGGDSLDLHGLSQYLKDPEGYGAAQEHKMALTFMEEFYDVFPKGVELTSNHNDRLYRKAYASGIPSYMVLSYKELLNAPKNWTFKHSHEVDNIKYEHGDRFGGQYAHIKAAQSNMKSTVIGHHHTRAGIQFISNEDVMIFGMNAGCTIDIESYAFRYSVKLPFKPTLGCGIVDKGVPHFIPMKIGKDKRWTGEL